MSCICSRFDIDEGYKCEVSGDRCVFLFPNSKRCAELFGEGPDAENEDLENEFEINGGNIDE